MIAAEYTATINSERLGYMMQRDELLRTLRQVQAALDVGNTHEARSISVGTLQMYEDGKLWPPVDVCTCPRFSDGVKVFPERKCEWCKENAK